MTCVDRDDRSNDDRMIGGLSLPVQAMFADEKAFTDKHSWGTSERQWAGTLITVSELPLHGLHWLEMRRRRGELVETLRC